MAKQQLTIHYRRLEDVTNAFNGQSLETAIRHAMNQIIEGGTVSSDWKRRAWALPANDDTLLMNMYHAPAGFFFGDLTHYTRGFLQALLAEMPDVPMLAVEQTPPPNGKEYVHSMMYWMAVGNHLLMVQSRSLSGKQLEEYLTWLLKDRTAAIGPAGQVLLQAKFDAADAGGDLADISEIIVGGVATVPQMEADAAVPDEEIVEAYREIAERRPWHERALEVLKAVMNNEADVQQLLNSIPDDAALQVSVHIGYKTRRRNVSRAPMQRALRNLPEGDITAVGKHGRLTGNDIRLSYPVRITKIGSLLDPDDVVRALQEAYRHFVDNGKIEP